MKVPILTHTFKCYGEDLPNSSFHFPNDKSVSLQILYGSLVLWKIIPLYFFSSNVMYFSGKGPIKKQVFETFEYSDQTSLIFVIFEITN